MSSLSKHLNDEIQTTNADLSKNTINLNRTDQVTSKPTSEVVFKET